MLHMDVFRQRIENEFDLSVIITNPSVFYKVHLKNGDERNVENPSDYPELHQIRRIEEPIVPTKIIVPSSYMGTIIPLCDVSIHVRVSYVLHIL